MELILRGLNDTSELPKLFSYYPKAFVKTPLDYFTKRINNDPYLIPADIRIAGYNEEIIGSVTVFRRKMYWNNKEIAFGGIGNVSTLPEKRGSGVAQSTMDDALKYIDNIPFGVVILFTGINAFYEKFNFSTIPAQHLVFQVKSNEYSDYIVRSFMKSDLIEVSEIYETFNKNLYGPIIRDNNYWLANLKFAEIDESFLIAERENKIQGYIRLVPGKSKNEIWEFGYTNIKAFNALLSETTKRLKKNILKTAALCPADLVTNNSVFSVSIEPSSIAMALTNKNMCNSELSEGFTNYCFWWTDNF